MLIVCKSKEIFLKNFTYMHVFLLFLVNKIVLRKLW